MANQTATKSLQPWADKAAIGLSLLCAIHCLALPVAAVLLPSVVALGFEDESFHLWIAIVAIPVSAFALCLGCGRHRRLGVLYTGLLGLLILCLTALVGHEYLGEFRERLFTLSGATLIAVSHVKNFRLCHQESVCDCPE